MNIPPQLQNEAFRFHPLTVKEIKLLPNGKKDNSCLSGVHWDKTNYSAKEMQEQFGHYPCYIQVLLKNQVVIDIEAHAKNKEEIFAALNKLDTFTVETWSGGRHYRVNSDGKADFINEDLKGQDGVHIGEIKTEGTIAYCPRTIVDGKEYKVINPAEIQTVSVKQIAGILKPFIRKELRKEGERTVKTGYWEILKNPEASEQERVSCVMQIVESHRAFDKLTVFDYIAKHNEWKNFDADKSKEKIFLTYNKYAKKPNPIKHEEFQAATNELIDFSKFEMLFDNTHTHLDSFKLVTEALSLEGKDYYVLKKLLTYKTESLRQQTVSIRIGKSVGDNRLHVILVGGAGKGKGQVKKIAMGKRKDCGTINAKRTHLEQLIGKIQKNYSHETEQKGYFKNKELLVDECHTLITEEDRNDAAVMSEIRKAADPYLYNLVEKKLVDTNKLSYYPETRFTLLSHSLRFPPVFFDLGTFRRFIACELKPAKIDENIATNAMFEENTEHQFEEYLNSDSARFDDLVFTKESKLIIKEYIQIWNRFTLKNPNQRVRMLAQRIFISVKEFFFTIIIILHISKNQGVTEKKLTRLACFDTIHFLLNTFQMYANNSNITLSRDIWQTTNLKEAMFFEWLYNNKATSREESKITISEAQESIGDIFGLQTKQSRSVFSKMKKDGFIDSIQSYQDSKTWLAFNPNFEGNVVFEEGADDDLYSFLEKEKLILHGGKNEE